MRNVFLFAVAALVAECAAMTNHLTYAASLGKFQNDGAAAKCDVTGSAEMTVTLFDSDSPEAQALWRRRLTVPIWDGDFAIELSDEIGVGDYDVQSRHSRLSDLFAAASPDMAYWVGLSKLTVDGKTPPDCGLAEFARGKITAVPFALTAERAAEARSSFTVAGVATLQAVDVEGAALVDGLADFRGEVKFAAPVRFGESGLVVTGVLYKTAIEDVGTLKAAKVAATQSMTAEKVEVLSGSSTSFTPAGGQFKQPKSVTVAGVLSSPVTVSADNAAARRIEVTGSLTLGEAGTIEWTRVGASSPTMSVPGGVYAADDGNLKELNAAPNVVWTDAANGTRHAISSYATASAKDGQLTAKIGGKPWLHAGGTNGPTCSVTSLVPLAPGEAVSFAAAKSSKQGTVMSRSLKEMSK